MIALVTSAFIVGVGGSLYGALLGSLNPQAFYIETTITTIVMLVVGGMRSLTGAVIGTTTVFTVSEILWRLEDGFGFVGVDVPARPGLQLLGVSLLALVILLLRPAGISGGREVPFPGRTVLARFGSRMGSKPPGGDASDVPLIAEESPAAVPVPGTVATGEGGNER